MNPNDPCLFCTLVKEREVIGENDLVFACFDQNPVTPLHTLIIPKRHMAGVFELNDDEVLAINTMMREQRKALEEKDPTITGWNGGWNYGADAGQTIFHHHFHMFPRRKGDHPNPRGGIRHFMPGKGDY